MSGLREQFLERLTRELFHKQGEGFVLKGGAAIRARFGEQRLTKDLDLDFIHPRRSADSLHHTIERAIAVAARGLPIHNLHVHTPGKAETSPRWKINFMDADDRPVHVEIETSRDPARAIPDAPVQIPYVPQAARGIARFWVDTYDVPALIAGKIGALLGRSMPRDIYDLDLLKDAGAAPSPALIEWALQRAGLNHAQAVETAWAHLDETGWVRFQSELLDALAPAAAARMDEAEWEALRLRVGTYVETLLRRDRS